MNKSRGLRIRISVKVVFDSVNILQKTGRQMDMACIRLDPRGSLTKAGLDN